MSYPVYLHDDLAISFCPVITDIRRSLSMVLERNAIPIALATFNVGVEIGQLAFVAAILLLRAGVARLPLGWPGWAHALAPYAIGTVAMFWVIERVGAFVLPAGH